MTISSAYQDAQAAHDADRIAGQIMRAFQKAARAADRSTRSMSRGSSGGRGGGRMPVAGRARRAPGSASQFHLHVKKSRATGARKSPISSVNKVKYDLGLDEKGQHADRVKVVLVDAPHGTPHAARNPLNMAAACEARARQSKFANGNTGQMLHLDAALPNNLSADRLAALTSDINKTIADQFGVPAYSGVHLDYGNFHIHSSIPLYEVHDDGNGGFTLGDRIDHAKRPSDREALGLPRSPAAELRELRRDIASLIADAVADETPDDSHIAERWRYGYLSLPQQVEQAAHRGDVEFVLDNISRDATRKEGPKGGFSKSDPRRDAAVAYNQIAGKPSGTPAPELITQTLAQRVIQLAQKAEIDTPEQFRMLARDHGLSVAWAPSKEGDGVQGVTFAVAGGPRIAGRRLGASLGVLQKKLGWSERPGYRRFAPRKGSEWDEYQTKIEAASIKPSDSSDRAIKITLDRLSKLKEQALQVAKAKETSQAAPAAALAGSVPAKGTQQETLSVRQRPKRRSNDPSFNKPKPPAAHVGRTPTSAQAAPATSRTQKNSGMNVDNLLEELRSIPSEVVPQPVVVALHKRPQQPQQPPAGAGVSRPPPRPALPDPATLTPHQRELIAQAWDSQQAQISGAFDGPLTRATEHLERLRDDLRKRLRAEPWPQEEPRKRFMRGTVMLETSEHRMWREGLETGRDRAAALEKQIREMIDTATTDTRLLAALPDLELRATAQTAERLEEMRRYQERQYADALERLERSPPGSYERTAAQSTIKRLMDGNPEISQRERQRRAEFAEQERQRLGVGHANASTERQRQR